MPNEVVFSDDGRTALTGDLGNIDSEYQGEETTQVSNDNDE